MFSKVKNNKMCLLKLKPFNTLCKTEENIVEQFDLIRFFVLLTIRNQKISD